MKASFNEVIRVELDFSDDLSPSNSIIEFIKFCSDNKLQPLADLYTSLRSMKVDAIFYKRDADFIYNWLKELEGSPERK